MINLTFKTTDEQRLNLQQIVKKMHQEKIHQGLISVFSELAQYDRATYNTLVLWNKETNSKEKKELIKDLVDGTYKYLWYLAPNE